MKISSKKCDGSFKLAALIAVIVVAGIVATLVFIQNDGWQRLSDTAASGKDGRPRAQAGFRVFTNDAESCRACHAAEFEDWARSHHAHANRLIELDSDRPAFDPARTVKIGSYASNLKLDGGQPVIMTMGPEGIRDAFEPDMVLAYFPLRQYLVPFPGGRWQSTELAFEPETGEWFNVYGYQDRRPDEWGFWTNRGMNWNSNCAACHMTGYAKNYNFTTDSYDSKWNEMGISCTQCHAGMDGHAEAFAEPPFPEVPKLTDEQVMHNCASCHSRRGELVGGFQSGDNFFDYYRLSLPSQRGLYYADGQIRDEVFVYGSFMMSKMGGRAGVGCLDCHNPHSGELILPADNNALCLSCHNEGNKWDAPVIVPVEHSFHAAESSGNRCVECHMSHTTYMERDPRRDHGFTSPDPLLTKELGVPNACNKCHDDQSVDWAIEWVDKWYGEKMERPERERTRLIARAYEDESGLGTELVASAKMQVTAAWQATLLGLAAPYLNNPEVVELATAWLQHESPLVRLAAIEVLGAHPQAAELTAALRDDPRRSVRMEANWLARASLQAGDVAYNELKEYLAFNADQPLGAARFGQFAYARGQFDEAEDWYQKAISWDIHSMPLYHDLAMMKNARANPEGAIATLEQALSVNSQDYQSRFMLGLLRAELGDNDAALQQLELAVEAQPEYYRAWYNISLLHAGAERLEEAEAAIRKAEEIDPNNPEAPFVRATLHARQGDIDAARAAAIESLQLDRDYQPAMQMLQQLGPPKAK